MSQSEITRLEKDLNHNPDLARRWAVVAPDPAAQARWARGEGYEVTAEEVALLSGTEELDVEELEKVAGGWDGTTPPPPDGSSGG